MIGIEKGLKPYVQDCLDLKAGPVLEEPFDAFCWFVFNQQGLLFSFKKWVSLFMSSSMWVFLFVCFINKFCLKCSKYK